MDDQELDARCMDWIQWCRTKRIYAPYVKGNVLGRLQPSKIRPEPDAELSQELAFMNMAIHAMAESDPDGNDLRCFACLWFSGEPRKSVAVDQGISLNTVVNRARRFAREAVRMGKVLRRIHTNERYGAPQVGVSEITEKKVLKTTEI
jgi:hypothetical protein